MSATVLPAPSQSSPQPRRPQRPFRWPKLGYPYPVVGLILAAGIGSFAWVYSIVAKAMGVASAHVRINPEPLTHAGWVIQSHVVGAVTSFVLGLVILFLPKGSTLHRRLGWGWVTTMSVTTVASFFIRENGQFTWIHSFTALTAVMLRCPFLDGTLDTLDDSEARRVAGVRDVIHIPGPKPDEPLSTHLADGIAVLADNTWAAIKGREQLKVTWKQGPWAKESTSALSATANELLDRNEDGVAVRREGDMAKARKTARYHVQARYEMPFLAHATMEPPGALIDLKQDSALLIASLQSPGGASEMISRLTGIPRNAVEIRMTRAGGGFGRRLENDFVGEAVLIAKAAGKPVKLMWTRDDDLQHDFYRPFGVHALAATLDRRKHVTSWSHYCAATPRPYRENGRQRRIFDGCLEPDDFPAGLVANLDKTFFSVPSGMPRGWWRAPIHNFHAFSVQSFVDEIAIATKQDAVKLRLEMLGEPRLIPYSGHGGPNFDTGRLANVLSVCADKIGWNAKRNDGHGVGIACHFTFGGYAAHAFEVSVARGELMIHRAVCVADVGRVVNPLGAEAQMMGGTIDAVSAALHLAITVKDGEVQQKNFPDYPLLKMAQAPQSVEVHLVESTAEPSGAGEIGVPSAAPALANAIYAATTVRVRKLPILPELKRML